jgi:hypothetical protein
MRPSLIVQRTLAGSVKGDVKKNTSPDPPWGRYFSHIQPLLAPAIHFARVWFCFSPFWEALCVALASHRALPG